MKRERIEIGHKRVLQRIYTHTYYVGEARKAAGTPPYLAAGVQASDSNRDMLTQHIHTSIAEAADMLTRYLGICSTRYSNESDTTALYIETPPNYPAGCIAQMAQAIEEYATARTLGQWLMLSKPDEAAFAVEEAQTAATRLRELLSIRLHPGRCNQQHDNNIEL